MAKREVPENAHDLFAQVFESSPDAIFVVSENGRIRQANTQAAMVFGYSRSD